jgi:hypothetical protein
VAEYFRLWDLLSEVVLQPDVDDSHVWQVSPSGSYSAKSAYEGFFMVLYSSDQRKEFGRAGHWANASFSCGWLHIIDAGRQTALLKGGCLTLYVARYAIRLKKQLTTC